MFRRRKSRAHATFNTSIDPDTKRFTVSSFYELIDVTSPQEVVAGFKLLHDLHLERVQDMLASFNR